MFEYYFTESMIKTFLDSGFVGLFFYQYDDQFQLPKLHIHFVSENQSMEICPLTTLYYSENVLKLSHNDVENSQDKISSGEYTAFSYEYRGYSEYCTRGYFYSISDKNFLNILNHYLFSLFVQHLMHYNQYEYTYLRLRRNKEVQQIFDEKAVSLAYSIPGFINFLQDDFFKSSLYCENFQTTHFENHLNQFLQSLVNKNFSDQAVTFDNYVRACIEQMVVLFPKEMALI